MSENPFESPPAIDDQPSITPKETGTEKVPVGVHIACGWPLLMIVIGGAIGGLLGGVAYAINIAIYKSKLPVPVKIVLIVSSGFIAFGLWFAIALAIHFAMSST